MTEKRLIQYKVLCDDYEEVRRILFEITETGEEIEGFHQIQEWVNNLYKENDQLHSELAEKDIQLDFLKDENAHMRNTIAENVQLKEQLKIFEKFLEENNLNIEWDEFCGVDECAFENPDFTCKECIYLRSDVE